jgi:transposase
MNILQKKKKSSFFPNFSRPAEQGEYIAAKAIYLAYEEKVGHTIHETTIYRLLRRHGWRKVQPRPRHPKADPQVQEAFKKNWEPPFKRHSKIESRMTIDQ